MNRHTLTEYQPYKEVPLNAEECWTLLALAPEVLRVKPCLKTGCYDLIPTSWIGAINLGTMSIVIRPKISIERVLFMISYATDPDKWTQTGFDYGEEDSICEAIIPGFVYQLKKALFRGLLQGYRKIEEATCIVRGRIRFNDQLKERYGDFPPVEIVYDDFTEDIEENRILKAAIEHLKRIRLRSDASKKMLLHYQHVLRLVTLVGYDPRQLPNFSFTRLNSHYTSAIHLAKLILQSASFDLIHGRVGASTFLIDMNQVFEDFVRVALREALNLSDKSFPKGTGSYKLFLDEGKRVRLKPDLSWWEDGSCVFLGDVKYKTAQNDNATNPDLYQLLAYTVSANLPGGILIYAEGVNPGRYIVLFSGKTLKVYHLDLSRSPEEILSDIAFIARGIIQQKRPSIARPAFRAMVSS